MKRNKFLASLVLILVAITTSGINNAFALDAKSLKGKILIQTESKGEVWYINPKDNQRYYVGSPEGVNSVAKKLGTGISNKDLEKIPVAVTDSSDKDTDSDGLTDSLEDSLGTDKNKIDTDGDGFSDKMELLNNYDPKSNKKAKLDNKFSDKQAGKILLQVESKGEAWYVNPVNKMRYFLGGTGGGLTNVVKKVGIGIKDDYLKLAKQATSSDSFVFFPTLTDPKPTPTDPFPVKKNLSTWGKKSTTTPIETPIATTTTETKTEETPISSSTLATTTFSTWGKKATSTPITATDPFPTAGWGKSTSTQSTTTTKKWSLPIYKVTNQDDSNSASSTTIINSEQKDELMKSIPSNAVIMETKVYTGKELGFQIDQSGHTATQVNITVNSKNAPAILFLGSYEPTIWNIKWTSGTVISAVVVSGYNRQVVAGLDDNTPIINSSFSNKSTLGYFYGGSTDDGQSDKLAISLFGRKADKKFSAGYAASAVNLGDETPIDEKLLTSDLIKPESFYKNDTPLAGQLGIDDAVKKGILRISTESDKSSWTTAYNNCLKSIGVGAQESPNWYSTYTVLKSFVYPAGLYNANAKGFIVLKGVPTPTGDFGHSQIYNFNNINCGFAAEDPNTKLTTPSSNKIDISADTVILQADLYNGKTIDYSIDTSSHAGTIVNATVNYQNAPVALVLSAYEPTIWNISWTEGTKISGIILSGYHTQKIAGIDSTVPIINSTFANGNALGYYIGVSSEYNSDKLSTSIYGRKADKRSDPVNEAESIVLGDKVPTYANIINSTLITAESLYRKDLPRTGKLGIDDAIAAKTIRISTQAEKDAWTSAYKKCLISAGKAPEVAKSFSSYTVLKDFVIPAGLWGVSPSSFIVPIGISTPTGESGAAKILNLNDVKCDISTMYYYY